MLWAAFLPLLPLWFFFAHRYSSCHFVILKEYLLKASCFGKGTCTCHWHPDFYCSNCPRASSQPEPPAAWPAHQALGWSHNLLQPQKSPFGSAELFSNSSASSGYWRKFCVFCSSPLHLNYLLCLNSEQEVQPLCQSPKWQIKTNLGWGLQTSQTLEQQRICGFLCSDPLHGGQCLLNRWQQVQAVPGWAPFSARIRLSGLQLQISAFRMLLL